MSNDKQKVIFLDRDGTINIDHGYVFEVARWQLTDRVVEALRQLRAAGYFLAIITNQSAIGSGKYTEADMHALHEHMTQQLAAEGVSIDVIAFCPHARDAGCLCRKPGTGMATTVEAALGPIDYSASWTVGDKEADIGFGQAKGMKTALIRSRYWSADALRVQPDLIVDSLWDFSQQITNKM